MSKRIITCTGAAGAPFYEGASVVVVGRYASRRKTRVRAKRIARAMGLIRPVYWTYHTPHPVAVSPDMHVEVLA